MSILTLSARGRYVVIFWHWLLCPGGRNLHCTFNRKLDGPQSWSGCFLEKKKTSSRNWTLYYPPHSLVGRLCLKCDGTRTETIFHLSVKWTSPFKSAGASVQSTTGSRGVRISGSNAGCTMFQALATHSIRQFSLHFPSRASLHAITFRLDSILAMLSHSLWYDWLLL